MSFPQRHPLCGPGAGTQLRLHAGPGNAGRAGFDSRAPAIAKIAGPRDPLGIGFGGLRRCWLFAAERVRAPAGMLTALPIERMPKPAFRSSSTK